MKTVVVMGAGSFGTAIANQLSFNNGINVTLFCRNLEQENEINTLHTNTKYFPNKNLNAALKATTTNESLSIADIIFIAIPSSQLKNIVTQIKPLLRKDTLVVNLTKGIFPDGVTIIDFLKTNLQHQNIVTLKGPTFSIEIINNEHSMFTLGYTTKAQYHRVNELLENTNIHIDYTTDILGVELLSALKNIYAIFIGLIDAKYNAINTRHMILTKAFSEIRILLKALGGKENTLFLACGFGDFTLTALNDLSRNRTLGLLLGKGFFTGDITKSSVVLEGLKTADLIAKATDEYITEQTPIFKKLQGLLNSKETNFDLNFSKLVDRKMKTVVTYGTFDLLHYGHVEMLRQFKRMGDRLIVGLSTDAYNKSNKTESGISYDQRKKLVEAIEYVDLVIPLESELQIKDDILTHEIDFLAMTDKWRGKYDYLEPICAVRYIPKGFSVSNS